MAYKHPGRLITCGFLLLGEEDAERVHADEPGSSVAEG